MIIVYIRNASSRDPLLEVALSHLAHCGLFGDYLCFEIIQVCTVVAKFFLNDLLKEGVGILNVIFFDLFRPVELLHLLKLQKIIQFLTILSGLV